MRTTKKQAEQDFKNNILPSVINRFEQDGKKDKPARREAWNNFTDMLCKDGRISDNQYNNWTQPAICN